MRAYTIYFEVVVLYDPKVHHRRSIRLKGYDYSQGGYYYITICTNHHKTMFGTVINEVMINNDAGKMILFWWNELESKFSNIALHERIAMPNHFHGIIQIVDISAVGADRRVCPSVSSHQAEGAHAGAPLHSVMQWFKTMTTNAYITGVKHQRWASFDTRLWQRNYYEHIIRTEKSYAYIAEYIRTNPQHWLDDKYNE